MYTADMAVGSERASADLEIDVYWLAIVVKLPG